jgi:hypothetical protein
MALPQLQVVVTPGLIQVLSNLCRANVRHPVDGTRTLIGNALAFTLSMGSDGATATVTFDELHTHSHTFASDPTQKFDDRTLGTTS